MKIMENAEEVFQSLEEFTKRRPKVIPRELEDYINFVARTGDPLYQWALIKNLFKEKLLNVITEFYETSPGLDIPQCPNVDIFNYETMKNCLLEKIDAFTSAPFTIQRICELLTAPRKQYGRIDKFMRAFEKNILVVSTRDPGPLRHSESENGEAPESLVNGSDSNSDYNVDVEMEDMTWKDGAELRYAQSGPSAPSGGEEDVQYGRHNGPPVPPTVPSTAEPPPAPQVPPSDVDSGPPRVASSVITVLPADECAALQSEPTLRGSTSPNNESCISASKLDTKLLTPADDEVLPTEIESSVSTETTPEEPSTRLESPAPLSPVASPDPQERISSVDADVDSISVTDVRIDIQLPDSSPRIASEEVESMIVENEAVDPSTFSPQKNICNESDSGPAISTETLPIKKTELSISREVSDVQEHVIECDDSKNTDSAEDHVTTSPDKESSILPVDCLSTEVSVDSMSDSASETISREVTPQPMSTIESELPNVENNHIPIAESDESSGNEIISKNDPESSPAESAEPQGSPIEHELGHSALESTTPTASAESSPLPEASDS